MMFCLLQVTYASIIISQVIKMYAVNTAIDHCTDIANCNYSKSLQLWKIQSFFFTFYWAGDLLAHVIFVMKYWIVSRKMSNIFNKNEDKNLTFKARLLFGV